MYRRVALGLLLTGIATLLACTPRQRLAPTTAKTDPDAWRTHAERTNHEESGRYDEAVNFCRRLAANSPHAHYTTFGRSGEGRDLPLLILSKDRAFTPTEARPADNPNAKPLILIQNCIHAGECEGKDACLELARDILITGARADLIEHANILIIPIFSTDGHERRSPYSRINQNGPREMGWRTTAVNLNLNRDYAKADAVEMQAWLRLWTAWQPDMLIDNHTTDGAEERYDLFYTLTWEDDIAPPLAAWMRAAFTTDIFPAMETDGYALLPYCWHRDRKNPAAGLVAMMPQSPRYSTGYGAACNRPSVLVETHARQPYARRVQTTYDFLRHILERVNEHATELRAAIRAADAESTTHRGGDSQNKVPVRFEPSSETRRITYRGYELRLSPSEITGEIAVEYTKTPLDTDTTLSDRGRVTLALAPPAAYLIPPQWEEVIRRLDWHGIRYERLAEPASVEVDSYRFDAVTFGPEPFESRQIPKYTSRPIHERRQFVAGTVVVPLDQPRAKLAVHLLEPTAPDSLIAWGLLNSIFEQKEYAEEYVMEPLARRMLNDDPALRAEFEAKVQSDPAFAKNPHRRLDFFYQRSPYGDDHLNVYPIARVDDIATLRSLQTTDRPVPQGSALR